MTYTLKVTFPTDEAQKAALQNVPSCAEPSERLPIPPDQAVSAQRLGSAFAKSAPGPAELARGDLESDGKHIHHLKPGWNINVLFPITQTQFQPFKNISLQNPS